MGLSAVKFRMLEHDNFAAIIIGSPAGRPRQKRTRLKIFIALLLLVQCTQQDGPRLSLGRARGIYQPLLRDVHL